MKIVISILLMMIAIAALFFAALRTYNLIQHRKRKQKKHPEKQFKKGLDPFTYLLYASAVVLIVVSLIIPSEKQEEIPTDTAPNAQELFAELSPLSPHLSPESTNTTNPSNWGINWEIFTNGTAAAEYSRNEKISFSLPENYFSLPGISTFRGNNFRDSATYGTAEVSEQSLNVLWTFDTGTLEGTSWSGSGWTGQPLIVQWDDETKQIMNLYESKKSKANLTEVIYATLDGNIYFLDLEDGTATRDPINVGLCFKGAGSLDPRGYPLMYVGAGDVNANGDRPRMYIISLIDGTILYEYGHEETLSLRTDNDNWCAFDSSPLVDAETDTLIWPGENGLLYTIKLNTQYDKAAGTLSVSPKITASARYTTSRSTEDAYWYGFEASADIVDNYLYVSENGGMFYCVDLNTMELIWAQDTEDDSNSSPVFEKPTPESGYIYTAPSLHWKANEDSEGTIHIYKLDAVTGEVVWQKPYDVNTVDGVSGGVQSTPLLGKQGSSIEGLIIYTIARTPTKDDGIIVALDTETGEEVWRVDMTAYTWSSPVAFYTEDGTAYVVVSDSWGFIRLLNGSTGEVLYTENLGYLVEASPAVFEDTLVLGTRGKQIFGIKIK